MNISFSPPDISELEISYVAEALRSGWITTGPRVKRLERELAAYVGVPDEVPNCVCLNSQTACGEAVLRILGIGPGDEVITCAYTYTATASVVCHVGATLVLVDTLPGQVIMDYDAVERAITERTKAIIPIDLGGVPCDYDRLMKIVESKRHLFRPSNPIQEAMGRIAISADAAHALGASRKLSDAAEFGCKVQDFDRNPASSDSSNGDCTGNYQGKYQGKYQGNCAGDSKMVGSIADFTSFSFHAVKNFTTGEGGALTWNTIPGVDDAEIYRRLQLYSLHGQSKDALAKLGPGAWEYDIVETGYKCNMTDIMAAIGQAQLERYPGLLTRRKQIIGRYDEALHPAGVQTLSHYNAQYQSSGHLYLTRIPGIDGERRNQIITRMAEQGVACNVHYKPLPMHTAYKKLGFDISDYPNAHDYFINEITLPLHTRLTDEEVEYILEHYLRCIREDH